MTPDQKREFKRSKKQEANELETDDESILRKEADNAKKQKQKTEDKVKI